MAKYKCKNGHVFHSGLRQPVCPQCKAEGEEDSCSMFSDESVVFVFDSADIDLSDSSSDDSFSGGEGDFGGGGSSSDW